jgi:hypothetical protein
MGWKGLAGNMGWWDEILSPKTHVTQKEIADLEQKIAGYEKKMGALNDEQQIKKEFEDKFVTEYKDYLYTKNSYESTPIYDALKEKTLSDYSISKTKDKHFLVDWYVSASSDPMSLTTYIKVDSQCFYCKHKVTSSQAVADEFIHYNNLDTPAFVHKLLSDLVAKSIKFHTSDLYVESNMDEAMVVVDGYTAQQFATSNDPLQDVIKAMNSLSAATKETSASLDGLESEYNEYIKKKSLSSSAAVKLAAAARDLPGINTEVSCPADAIINPYPPNELIEKCSRIDSLLNVIAHLNDHHRWTRERIADWLEEIHDPTGENGPNINFRLEETT